MEKMGFFERLLMTITLFSVGMCAVLILSNCANQSNAPYLSDDEAIRVVSSYAYGGTINIDELMFDQGYYPVNRNGGVCSWTNGQDHIWLDANNGHITAVVCEAGFDQCYWEDLRLDVVGEVNRNGERCEISATALAALISVANGHYDGFTNV